MQELVSLNARGDQCVDSARFSARHGDSGCDGAHHLQRVVPILLELVKALFGRPLRIDQHHALVLRQHSVLVELLLKAVVSLRKV
ncbi:MAG: hypothetical protein N2Z63_11240 [Thiobacillaceae bacterium]|nr:hypothetical protein [Thiobacillaceae bacterium]